MRSKKKKKKRKKDLLTLIQISGGTLNGVVEPFKIRQSGPPTWPPEGYPADPTENLYCGGVCAMTRIAFVLQHINV